MCMCTYFLFQCIDVCTVSKCFYTEPFPLLLSFDVGQLPMMTSEWRERKEGRESAREERRGYTFCVTLLEEKKEEKIVHLFH